MTISVHGPVSVPSRGITLASGLNAHPSNFHHALERHQDGVLKLHSIAHLLVAVETGKNALDNLSSADVADEVFVDGIVDCFERGFFIATQSRPLTQNSIRDEHLTTILNRTDLFSRRRNFQSCIAERADNSNQLPSASLVSRDPLRGSVQFVGSGDALSTNVRNTSERHKNCTPDFKNIIAHCAAINSHARPLDQFGLANLGDEKLGRDTWFNHFRSGRLLGRVHKASPKKNAASSRGKPLTALVHAPGAQCNHNNPSTAKTTASTIPTAIAAIIASLSDIHLSPRKNQSAKKYSAINPTAAAPIPMIRHMRSLVAFAAQFAHSNLSHLRSVVAASVASIVLARPSFADADREGA